MPRTCTICKHPQRLEIERDIVNGTSLRDIAGRFGTAKTSIARHRTHVTAAIARSKDTQESVRTGVLLDDVRAGERRAERLYEKAEEILTAAVQNGDGRTALLAIRTAVNVMGEARGYLELRGELTNELGRDRAPGPSPSRSLARVLRMPHPASYRGSASRPPTRSKLRPLRKRSLRSA